MAPAASTRHGQVIRLRPDKKDEYLALHAAPWPSVLSALEAASIRNYSIFLREPEMLMFGVFDYCGLDFAEDMRRMAEDPEVQRWWTLTDACQEKLATATAREWWVGATEVFHHP